VPHNPLKRSSQQPLRLPDDWLDANFADTRLPLHLDIGADRGRFCLGMAAREPGTNFLGLEIRERPVREAQEALAAAPTLRNCAFLHANANCHLGQLLPHLAGAHITTISLNFPDPWTKKKHHKRRVLQPEFMPVLARALAPGGRFVVQTDVLELAEDMRGVARGAAGFADAVPHMEDWMQGEAVFPVMTEWQTVRAKQGCPVYRFVMYRQP